jgi:hypothetical protein
LTEPSKFYEESLYPLQDGVLRLIQQSGTDFFLTGGTALSRAYYKHRYSDDLDFFVNNSPNFDDFVALPLFHRVDPIGNILSNKIGALFRGEGKDVADIREIALHEAFRWDDVINEARQKDGGVELSTISELLDTVPRWAYDQVIWQEPPPSWEEFDADIKQIAHDMIRCEANSLSH